MDPGTRLGPYEIKEPLGAGGMGEVYRAHDDNLRREVAVKLLPDELADDPQRLGRLRREARSLASLNHSHIATIHGFEEHGGISFIVMELVEGLTLSERLVDGPVPVEEALELGIQIAKALEAAHERGIVHRDLKPSNIKITPVGEIKVLDFGLAKPVEAEGMEAEGTDGHSRLPTATVEATRTGAVMGTAAYMSPEQARGEAADRHADIWAFGCVLYEMLTGRRAFRGESVSETLAAVLRDEVDWSAVPEETPLGVRSLLQRCLRRNPRRRLHHVADARIELEDALEDDVRGLAAPAGHRDSSDVPPTGPAAARLPLWPYVSPTVSGGILAAGLLAILGAVAWAMLASGPASTPSASVVRASIPIPAGQTIAGKGRSYRMALSRDGRRLAYVAEEGGVSRLYVRELAESQARLVPETEGAEYPFFSPDGQWIGFWAAGRLQKVPVTGRRPLTICSVPSLDRGAAWGADDTIVYSDTATGMFRVSASGGEPVLLVEAHEGVDPQERTNDSRVPAWPDILPDGRWTLVTRSAPGGISIELLDLETKESSSLLTVDESVRQARYLRTGYLLYGSAGDVIAVPFDIETSRITGEPVAVLGDVYEPTNSGAVHFAVADDGTLVYLPFGTEHALLLADSSGNTTPLTGSRAAYRMPTFSPDGSRVAVAIDADPDPSDIWIFDLDGSARRRLTYEFHNLAPTWTPDGQEIAFLSWRRRSGEPFIKPVSGGEAEPLLPLSAVTPHIQGPQSWSPDGLQLVFREIHPETESDLWLLDRSGPEPGVRPLLVTPFDERSAHISPDGRWIAYSSNETGLHEVYVSSFPDARNEVAISTQGGTEPRWSRDGRELFFRNGDRMMVVSVESDDRFRTTAPRELFEGNFGLSEGYDVSPDGQRLVIIEPDPGALPDHFELVLNWTEELKRLVPPS